jgi:hypothetical protein
MGGHIKPCRRGLNPMPIKNIFMRISWPTYAYKLLNQCALILEAMGSASSLDGYSRFLSNKKGPAVIKQDPKYNT